jgi:hypothetical protein
MNVFTLQNGEEVVVIDGNVVIDYSIYCYEDILNLVKSKVLTIDESSLIFSALSSEPASDEIIEKYAREGDSYVRSVLAMLGYALDILVDDPASHVRSTVAEKGYGLEKLINDPDPIVRSMVAYHQYGLDVLVNDPSDVVREIVAEQGYGLDKLINDRSHYVRAAVAEQGYGLDVLANDNHPYVREIANEMIAKQQRNGAVS